MNPEERKDVAVKTSRGKKYMGIVPVELLHYFRGSALLNDVFIESKDSPNGCRVIAKAGSTITKPMIEDLMEFGVSFASVTSHAHYVHLKETGELNRIYNIPTKDEVSGYDTDKIRDDFYKISAEAMTSRGLEPDTVNHMMRQLVGISESILNFGQVLQEMRSMSNFSEYTYKHSLEVMIMSLLLAKQLEKEGKITNSDGTIRGMTQKEIMSLAIGSFFHDFGKTMVPWEILEKPGRLNDEEKKSMDEHVSAGWLLMKNMVLPALKENFGDLIDEKMVLDIVGGHHWRYDGNEKAYRAPGVDPKNIHPWSYIVGVADSVDAMGTTRPYQNRKHNMDIKAILRAEKGKQFHPDFVDSMLNILIDYPQNSIAVFKDGSFGTVAHCGRTSGCVDIEMHGTFTSSGVERSKRRYISLSAEEAKRDIAVGVCYFNVLDREVARYIERNPDGELTRNILKDGKDRISSILGDSVESVDNDIFAKGVKEYINAALGGESEIKRVAAEIEAKENKRIAFSHQDIGYLVRESLINRMGESVAAQVFGGDTPEPMNGVDF